MQEQDNIEIKGIVESVTFHNESNGFTVLELDMDGELVTAVGILPHMDAGESLRLLGHWDYHASFGKQFKINLYERSMPKTSADLMKYLSSGAIKGIGPSTASKIIEAFGDETFDVLENDVQRLSAIRGISLNKAEQISKAFREQFAVREIMIALEKYGMSPNECLRAFKVLGNNVVTLVENNPYLLCTDAINIGFERVDSIAQSMSGQIDRMHRIKAGILYVIKHNLANGHTCVPRDKLIFPSQSLLDASEDEIEIAIDNLLENKQLIAYEMKEKTYLFLPHIYHAERSIANRIQLMMNFPPAGKETLEKSITELEKKNHIQYESKQRLAIATAVEKGMLILTGGPGTGKTTTLNGILKLFEHDGLEVALAAPTGRAAKRMSEVTGHEAKTIHRLLEVEWDKEDNQVFSRNMRNPLSANAVIIDELSMVDVTLFASLLEALPLGCRLVMVGDCNQLPAVGAGNVLHDLIESGLIPVVELTEVFRQAMESYIVTNAHKIVRGDSIEANRSDKDFFVMEKTNASAVTKTVAELCVTRLPKAYGFSPLSDIQVLCPSRKGENGTVAVNNLLQSYLNPASADKREISVAGRILREGDKVMQIKNNYDINWHTEESSGQGVYNGDIGLLQKIDFSSGTVTVQFDDRTAVYPMECMHELELAYAVTVHKSQGNEFDAVIMPVFRVIPQLCYRNLLYTAVTRAKKLMILVGSAQQIQAMIENDKKTRRFSALKHMLNEKNSFTF